MTPKLRKLLDEATARPYQLKQLSAGTLDVAYSDGKIWSSIARLHVEALADEHNRGGGIKANARLLTLAANHFEAVVGALKNFADEANGRPHLKDSELMPVPMIWLRNTRALLAKIEAEAAQKKMLD